MKAVLALVLLVGCGTDVSSMGGGGGDDTMGSGSNMGSGSGGGGTVTDVSGKITTDTTWFDTINVKAATTIAAGVTVTVMPGTTINVSGGVIIRLEGSLDIQGTSASKVTLQALPGGFWGGFSIPAGGQLTMDYGVQTGGGIHITGGKATIADSRMAHVSGDLLTMNGGTVDMQYSAIGFEPGTPDTTHCDMHVQSPGNIIKVTHSNISTSSYGIMFYGGTGADFRYDNWFSNAIDVHTQAATPASGDFSFGWFEKGTGPTGNGITANSLASARVTDAGPRP
jgi:hypothetical protein